jgi:hypothetical protein
MHVDRASRHYTAADGSVRGYRRDLLRRSYRDEQGRPRKETLANLWALPEVAIEVLRKALSGTVLVEPDTTFEIERSVSHGGLAAVHAMATKLGVKKLLGPECRERDLAYALVLSRVLRPTSKLSTLGWWNDTTLGTDLGIAQASTDEVYAAMDWLGARQDTIEKTLAGRHFRTGGIAMFDLSSSWVEGRCCELAAFGYSRDKKRGVRQIEYGLLTDGQGRPVAIRVFPGNTSDTKSFIDAVSIVRENFGLTEITMVGDRGMITNARIKELRGCVGMDWITALRAPAIAVLASNDGPPRMSLFDTQNFAEITHPDYPGERLVCCRNPALADQRARTRQELLAATDLALATIAARVRNGTLRGVEKIGVAVGKIVNKDKMANTSSARSPRSRSTTVAIRNRSTLKPHSMESTSSAPVETPSPWTLPESSPPTKTSPTSNEIFVSSRSMTSTCGPCFTTGHNGSVPTCSCTCSRPTSPGTSARPSPHSPTPTNTSHTAPTPSLPPNAHRAPKPKTHRRKPRASYRYAASGIYSNTSTPSTEKQSTSLDSTSRKSPIPPRLSGVSSS